MNLMHSMKLIVWEWMVRWNETVVLEPALPAGGQLWRISLAGGLLVAAQEPDASAQTNDVTAAEVLSQLSDLVQAADSAQPEDMAPPNDLTATNGLPQANAPSPSGDRADKVNRLDNSSRSQNDDRRSRGRRSPGQGPTSPVVPGRPTTTAGAATARRPTPSPGQTTAPPRWITPPSRSSWTGISSTPTAFRTAGRGPSLDA